MVCFFCTSRNSCARTGADAVESGWCRPDQRGAYRSHYFSWDRWSHSAQHHLFLFTQGTASLRRQLQFLEQLLSLVPGCKKSAGSRKDAEMLLNEVYATENLPHLSQMLTPTLNPWPSHIKYVPCGGGGSNMELIPRSFLIFLASHCFLLLASSVSVSIFALFSSLSLLVLTSQNFTKKQRIII